MPKFEVISEYTPSGDQPEAIAALAAGIENGLDEQADEMRDRIMGGECGSYYEALNVIAEYVNITGPEEAETMKMEGFG